MSDSDVYLPSASSNESFDTSYSSGKEEMEVSCEFYHCLFSKRFFFFERTHTKLLKVLRFKKHSSNLGDFTHERQFLIKFIAAAVSLRFDELWPRKKIAAWILQRRYISVTSVEYNTFCPASRSQAREQRLFVQRQVTKQHVRISSIGLCAGLIRQGEFQQMDSRGLKI